jgi:WD40 repeat protein
MLTFNHVLAEAPMQLYNAGLHFSPSYSIFRKAFSSEASTDLEVRGQLPSEWNACTYTLEGHSDGVNSVVFSLHGSRIASGSDDNTVRVWDVQTGQCQHTLKGHSDRVSSVVFSHDGSRVASGSNDKTVRV